MGIRETFSKRQRRLARAGQQDVYQYDDLPSAFRVQVVEILNDAIGLPIIRVGAFTQNTPSAYVWGELHKSFRREQGVFQLTGNPNSAHEDYVNFILTAETEKVIDAIEFAFQGVDRVVRNRFRNQVTTELTPDEAIEELNQRFKEHCIGYQFINGVLMRVDSQFIHAEIVKPALSLLSAQGFDGPAEEFIKAFEHHRHGRDKESVVEALKAFESTMKAICAVRKWKVDPTATAKDLIKALLANGLIPPELESHFGALRTAMESGLPTVRNRTSGHGQGAIPVAVPPHIAAYALHLAAANINLLVEAHKAKK